MAWKLQRLRFMKRSPAIFRITLFFFFSVSALLSSCTAANPDLKIPVAGEAELSRFQGVETITGPMNVEEATKMVARRLLSWPGSSPPRCISKCGKCTPCKAVHVAVPPGTPTTQEYYPEAWRCKCGNKLYMP